MAGVSAKIVNLKQFDRKLKKLDDQSRGAALVKSAHAGALQLIAYIKLNINLVHLIDMGNLIGSVTEDQTFVGPRFVWITLGPHTVYARIHEFGGIIRPTKAKMLHWFDKAGVEHFAYAVHMPARPYLRPALDDHGDDVGRAIGAVLGAAIDEAFANG